MSIELSPEESRRRAAGINELLDQIANSPTDKSDWWDLTTYDELDGRKRLRLVTDGFV